VEKPNPKRAKHTQTAKIKKKKKKEKEKMKSRININPVISLSQMEHRPRLLFSLPL
jgi:hypothetical protein